MIECVAYIFICCMIYFIVIVKLDKDWCKLLFFYSILFFSYFLFGFTCFKFFFVTVTLGRRR